VVPPVFSLILAERPIVGHSVIKLPGAAWGFLPEFPKLERGALTVTLDAMHCCGPNSREPLPHVPLPLCPPLNEGDTSLDDPVEELRFAPLLLLILLDPENDILFGWNLIPLARYAC